MKNFYWNLPGLWHIKYTNMAAEKQSIGFVIFSFPLNFNFPYF